MPRTATGSTGKTGGWNSSGSKGRAKSGRKRGRTNGMDMVLECVQRAKERLYQYQQEKAMQEEMELDGFGVGGSGHDEESEDFFGMGDGADSVRSVGNSLGFSEQTQKAASFLTSLGPLGTLGAIGLGMVNGALSSSVGRGNGGGKEDVPGGLDDDDAQAYQEFLIEELGFMAFQDGDWSWTPAEEYVRAGGFYNNDTGRSILGILYEGIYYYGNQ